MMVRYPTDMMVHYPFDPSFRTDLAALDPPCLGSVLNGMGSFYAYIPQLNDKTFTDCTLRSFYSSVHYLEFLNKCRYISVPDLPSRN